MASVHAEQASADFYHLAEMVKDYVGLVAAVKDVFQVRWSAKIETVLRCRCCCSTTGEKFRHFVFRCYPLRRICQWHVWLAYRI